MSYRDEANGIIHSFSLQVHTLEQKLARADAEIAGQRDSLREHMAMVRERDAEIAALRADAERWRKLRGMHWTQDGALVVTIRGESVIGGMTYSGERLDAAIDAAIKAARGESSDA